MRCAKCGRLVGAFRPVWALPCMCGNVGEERTRAQAIAEGRCGKMETQAERDARIDALAERAKAAGHTGLEALVVLAKGRCGIKCAHATDVHDCPNCDPHVGFECAPIHPCAACPKCNECLWMRTVDCSLLEAWKVAVHMPVLVEAIRADKAVGRGSCSSIDEAWEDAEIGDALGRAGIADAAKAVEWARLQEGLCLEHGLNQRWGEDDDPQLKAYQEFKEKCR